MATLSDYLSSQEELLREAAEALPHSFSQCTHSLGPIKQAVYLCLTCPEERGLCSACSVACHTHHEQVELFPKRRFRCDCPTSAIANQCTLHKKLEDPNEGNHYGQNFKNAFCRCGRAYDANKELETMIQCLACEDWFHESCCNLRERPSSRENTPVADPPASPSSTEPNSEGATAQDEGDDDDDAASEASSSGLPPPLISGDEYESMLCRACVLRNPTLKRWAGTPGAIIVVRDDPASSWYRLGGSEHKEVQVVVDSAETGTKRPLSPDAGVEEPDAKRIKASSSSALAPAASSSTAPCLAPPQPPLAKKVIEELSSTNVVHGAGDIFFTEGFRERWCRCASCLPSLEANPYLLEDEEVYEPRLTLTQVLGMIFDSCARLTMDPGLSLEELGMRALARLPRDKAIDGIHAFNEMRDDLVKFLRPFAQEGKVVGESDVQGFFAALKEGQAAKRR